MSKEGKPKQFADTKFGKFLGFTPEKHTTVGREILAGLVTFLTMCYILTVNPIQIIGAPSDPKTNTVLWSTVFIATAFGAIIGTLLMAFYAKMPLAQAPGMGLNSLIGTMLIGVYGGVFYTLGQAMMMVLISGIIFLLLTVITVKGKSFRELVFDGMPVAVRAAIPVGIGLFIAYIGFQNAGLIITQPYTQIGVVNFNVYTDQIVNYKSVIDNLFEAATTVTIASPLIALLGLAVIAILERFKVHGSIIIGILVGTLVGIPCGITKLDTLTGNAAGITWKFWENFGNFFSVGPDSAFGSFATVFTEGFPPGSVFTVIMLIISFCMIDMFDTMGTIVGCCAGVDVLADPKTGKPHNYGRIMLADSIATCTGAMLGTSTVTTFVESGSGVAAGGRTGLTALTVACLFFLSIFLLPVFATIPSEASASALIYVGVLMMKNNIQRIDFSTSINAVSAFLTIVIMLVGYSITKGIGFGMVFYTVLSLIEYVVELCIWAVKKGKSEKAPAKAEQPEEPSAEASAEPAAEAVADETAQESSSAPEAPAEKVEAIPALEKPKFKVSITAIVVTVLFLVYFLVPTTI